MKPLLLVLGMLPAISLAGEVWLTAPITSWHSNKQREDGKGSYEQTNPGLGLEYSYSPKFRLQAGLYRNSIRSDTGYAGLTYLPASYGDLRAGVSVGVVSGYTGNLLPILVPTMTLEGRNLGLNVLLIPPHDDKPGGFGLVLKWRLP